MDRGVPAPDWIADQPAAESHDAFYINAFWELSTERALGFTVGPIPMSAIRAYPGAEGFSYGMMRLFETAMRSMDAAYLKWAESERSKASTKKPKPVMIDGTSKA